jgi:hypothetical protein
MGGVYLHIEITLKRQGIIANEPSLMQDCIRGEKK